MTPFGVRNKISGDTIPVPCGKCPECVARRVSAWSFRLMQEEKVSSSAHFITLTYDTQYCPITRNGFMSLVKRDVQLFFKRLRKRNTEKVRYYVVGEYGGKSNRPHYHAILFNADISTIQDAWSLGNVHYGQVTGASIGYTLKYMSKRGRIPMHRNDDRLPEFALMSKGLGANYLTNDMVQWHLRDIDNRVYCTIEGGKKVTMPRYYKDKLFSELYFESQDQAIVVRKRMAFFAQQRMIIEKLKKEQEYKGDYWRDKAENDKAAFLKMASDADKNKFI